MSDRYLAWLAATSAQADAFVLLTGIAVGVVVSDQAIRRWLSPRWGDFFMFIIGVMYATAMARWFVDTF